MTLAWVERPGSVLITPPPDPVDGPNHAQWFTDEVHPHEPSLRAYLRSSFPSLQDVDDTVQESCLRVWKARTSQPIHSAKAFLFTVARRLALNALRRSRRSPIVAVTDLSRLFVLDEKPDARDAATTNQEIDLLVQAVDALPRRCREIFILRRLQGIPQKEIAARLGLSEQTVQVQAARGLVRVRDWLQTHFPRE